ncbi:MAG: hypothetical protein QXU18_14190 [Thermoplasmatales archaeon]
MIAAERRISRLEQLLKKETNAIRGERNYYKIGLTEFELSQLYKLLGATDKSNEILKEASLTIQNPECKKGKKAEKLANLISFCVNNPTAPPVIQIPGLLRYLSPILLLVGYAAAYITYFTKLISYMEFFAIIIVVFISSMVVTGVVTSTFTKEIRKNYAQPRSFGQGSSDKSTFDSSRTPDDVVDDARAELSLANMYYSTKNFKEMEIHLKKAKSFLSDPTTVQSKKKEQAIDILNRLEGALQEKKPSDHYGLY